MYKSLQEVVLKAVTVCLQKLLSQMHDGLVVKSVASQQSWFGAKRPDPFSVEFACSPRYFLSHQNTTVKYYKYSYHCP